MNSFKAPKPPLESMVKHVIDCIQEQEVTQVNIAAENMLHALAQVVHDHHTHIKFEALVIILAGAFEASYSRFIASLPANQRVVAEEARRQVSERMRAATFLPVDEPAIAPGGSDESAN